MVELNSKTILMLAAFLVSFSSATAAITTVTVTGTATDGVDSLGYFGTPGLILDGKPFVAAFRFDLSEPHLAQYFSNPAESQILGGSVFGFTSATQPPFAAGSVTINGVSQPISGQRLAGLQVYSNEITVNINNLSSPLPTGLNFDVSESGTATINSDYLVNQTYYVKGADVINSSGVFLGTFGTPDYLDVDLLPTAIQIETSAAPEPSTWAMVSLGVLGLGVTSRARRRASRESICAQI